MIKINVDNFDMDIIQNVYMDKKNGVITKTTDKIRNYIEGRNKNQTLVEIYKKMFGENISEEEIGNLLLGKKDRLEKYIRIYKKNIVLMSDEIEVFWKLSTKTYLINVVNNMKDKMKDTKETTEFYKKFDEYYRDNTYDEKQKLSKDIKDDFLEKKYPEQLKAVQINDMIAKHFDYISFSKEYRHELIVAMNINTCPYCNRQYITSYYDQQMKTTADLDHFYPKSKYPYLALSLYNFVPSCQICNSRFKGDKNSIESPHLYPYEQEFGEDAKFKIKSNNIDYLISKSKVQDFKIVIDNKAKSDKIKKSIEQSIETFHLESVYDTHKSYVVELIKKLLFYNEAIQREYSDNFSKIFTSEEEIRNLIFGEYIFNGDFSKRPLSKLTKDILDDLNER